MTNFPLVFRLTNTVKTAGYHAAVITEGRALLIRHAGDDWVCSAVEPGGLDAEGNQPAESTRLFIREYQTVLEDIASDSPSFQAFERAVREFFADKNCQAEKLWDQAVTAIESGRVAIDPVLTNMLRKPGTRTGGIEVSMLKDLPAPPNVDEVALVTEFAKAA